MITGEVFGAAARTSLRRLRTSPTSSPPARHAAHAGAHRPVPPMRGSRAAMPRLLGPRADPVHRLHGTHDRGQHDDHRGRSRALRDAPVPERAGRGTQIPPPPDARRDASRPLARAGLAGGLGARVPPPARPQQTLVGHGARAAGVPERSSRSVPPTDRVVASWTRMIPTPSASRRTEHLAPPKRDRGRQRSRSAARRPRLAALHQAPQERLGATSSHLLTEETRGITPDASRAPLLAPVHARPDRSSTPSGSDHNGSASPGAGGVQLDAEAA